jgi:hypothetical protein
MQQYLCERMECTYLDLKIKGHCIAWIRTLGCKDWNRLKTKEFEGNNYFKKYLKKKQKTNV